MVDVGTPRALVSSVPVLVARVPVVARATLPPLAVPTRPLDDAGTLLLDAATAPPLPLRVRIKPLRCMLASFARRCSSIAACLCWRSASLSRASLSRASRCCRSTSRCRAIKASRSACSSSSRVLPCHAPLLKRSFWVCSVCDRIRTHISSSLSVFWVAVSTVYIVLC